MGEVAAWNCGGRPATLTWVHSFEFPGKYHGWVRKYGGYGEVEVTVDEQPPEKGRDGPGGAKCVRNHLGSSPWAYRDAPDNRIYDPDEINHQISYPDEFSDPIPTLAWEAHRAGIDDARYVEALDRALAAAKQRLEQAKPSADLSIAIARGQAVRRERFESIQGRWFEYLCRLRPGDLETSRRDIADAIVQINRSLAGN